MPSSAPNSSPLSSGEIDAEYGHAAAGSHARSRSSVVTLAEGSRRARGMGALFDELTSMLAANEGVPLAACERFPLPDEPSRACSPSPRTRAA